MVFPKKDESNELYRISMSGVLHHHNVTYRFAITLSQKSAGLETPAGRSGRFGALADPDQREVAERRNQAALRQFDVLRARQPGRVARPGEFGGAETEMADHRLQSLLDEAAHTFVGADTGEDDQFAARPEHAGEFIQRTFWIRHGSDDVLRHHDVEGVVFEFELLGVHHRKPFDILQLLLG